MSINTQKGYPLLNSVMSIWPGARGLRTTLEGQDERDSTSVHGVDSAIHATLQLHIRLG